VTIDGRRAGKPGERIGPAVRLEAQPAFPWVSRAGLKLAAALDAFAIDPAGAVCLDVGASTGGFTDVLRSRGAARIYAVDVGHDQLHASLRADPRVVDLSGTDARALTLAHLGGERPGLIACDTSFISLRLVLPAVLGLAGETARLVALVKPQFEVGVGRTDRGIVRDEGLRAEACAGVAAVIVGLGWRVIGTVPSPVTGRDGNVEYLVGAERP
jgi:23S rRNA (cytidine1920-2'-O)/16S rRNA (cytidine1409-2'-O)-methyltransferase